MNEEQQPLVSVVMIAYNVEQFIGEAIESVLSQNVSFIYELVIGEDCSQDKTREIAIEYEAKYPDKIRVLQHSENLGLTPNCVATHNACKGKYIALLDSDDYWTDNNKLQKQIEFLERKPEYAGVGHQSVKIYEEQHRDEELFGETAERDYFINDMITHRKFHTSSFVYRKEIWDKCGGIPENISSNERAIYPMVAIFGKIKYLKECMCVYRITGKGLTSRVDYKALETDFNMLPWLKKMDSNFPVSKFRSFLHLCNYTYGVKRLPFNVLIKHYMNCVFYSFSYFPENLKDVKWATVFFVRRLKKSNG